MKNTQQGMSLVEVVIASVIASLIAIFVGVTVAQFASLKASLLNDAEKLYLAEEGYEMIRFVRDDDWSTLSAMPPQTHYYLKLSTSTIEVGLIPEIIEGEYLRSFRLLPLYRNNQGNIVSSTTPGAVVGVSDNRGRELNIYVSDDFGTTTLRSLLMNFSAL